MPACRPSQHKDGALMGRWRKSNVGAEFSNPGRRSVALHIRVIVVHPPERAVTDTADLGPARLRTGQGQG